VGKLVLFAILAALGFPLFCQAIGIPPPPNLPIAGFIGGMCLLWWLHDFAARKADEAKARDREDEERELALRIARIQAGLPEAEEIED
jgi:hypothetical protein